MTRKRNGDSKFKDFFISLKVGLFLAVRQVRRTSKWTNILVICVMTLTFLNLVVVSGVLVGLIEGAISAVKAHYLGDIFISDLQQRAYIEQSSNIIQFAQNLPGVQSLTARYIEGGTIESEYNLGKKKPTDLDKSVSTLIVGINPEAENKTTGLAKLVVEGEYLAKNDYDKILVGSMLLQKYLDFDSPSFPTLKNVNIGDKVRISVNGNVRDVTVKGITRSKVDEVDRRVFMVDSQLRGLIGRTDYNVDEIVLRLIPSSNPVTIKNMLVSEGFDKFARVQTQEDAEPKFIKDMKRTFDILGNVISSIGLAVASITIFIVIFINAITRRKFIGILKGIGIHSLAIQCSYILQSVFYAAVGTIIGVIIVFGFLKPYLDVHPINFPFSDGILVATAGGTIVRIVTLMLATLIAGYIPARIVTKQNTLDAILNR